MDEIQRFITEDFPEIPFNETGLRFYPEQCHWGQKKLIYSEIEFLTKVSMHIDLKDCLVLYVGSAQGIHMPLLQSLFDINMMLYDPEQPKIKQSDKIKIVSGEKGWFSEKSIPDVLSFQEKLGKKYIVYICDIRDETDNDSIWEDMVMQQRWGIIMEAEFMLLKFRPAYINETTNEMEFIFDTSGIEDKIVEIGSNKGMKKSIQVLEGKIYFQIFPSKASTESRQFVKKIKYHDDSPPEDGEKYYFNYYDIVKYESQMNYFNIITRNEKMEFEYPQLEDYILGFKPYYCDIAEYYITEEYIRDFRKIPTTYKNVSTLMMIINIKLMDITDNNMATCNINSIYMDILNLYKILKRPLHNIELSEIKYIPALKLYIETFLKKIEELEEVVKKIKELRENGDGLTEKYINLLNEKNMKEDSKIKIRGDKLIIDKSVFRTLKDANEYLKNFPQPWIDYSADAIEINQMILDKINSL